MDRTAVESSESVLVDHVEDLLFKRQRGRQKVLLREIDCWQGRADVVTAAIRGEWNISNSGLELLARLGHASILALLYRKHSTTIDDVAMKTGLSVVTVKRYVRDMTQCNLVEKVGQDSIVLHSDLLLPTIQFQAYEAKLHDWKRALYQAVNYLGFSQCSSVVMPERYISTAYKNIHQFEKNGVGLFSLTENGLKMHIAPRKNRPRRRAFHLVGVGKALLALKQSNLGLLAEQSNG